MKREIVTHSERETYAFAKSFAEGLKAGDIISLDGDLGAGKTIFTKGLCDGLGVKDVVNSPTYTLVNEYTGRGGKVFHFDVYRIGDEEELYDIGFTEYLDSGAVSIIEWGTYARGILEEYPNVLYIQIKKAEEDEERKIIIL